MNIRSFTIDESSGLDKRTRGSYLGVIDKVRNINVMKIEIYILTYYFFVNSNFFDFSLNVIVRYNWITTI